MAGLAIALLSGTSAVAFGQPILHELFALDAEEDQRLGATTSNGAMPAAMHTESGWVTAPDPSLTSQRSASPTTSETGMTYGGAQATSNSETSFALDNLTSRPRQVKYDEPFRPSILPYKRLFAFDTLGQNFSLQVGDPALEEIPTGGQATDEEDAFFGDFEVDLVAGVPVRIPTVGPGARLLSVQVDPPRKVNVLRDGADNWFLVGSDGGRARAFVQIAVDRDSFGSPFAPVSRAALRPYLPPVPVAAQEVAQRVLNHIGIGSDATPAGVLHDLVGYFRSFQESDELPLAERPLELYEEISLSKKGVCRHRAYAFVVTALSWGLPARLVHNEAHAWVEVFDSRIWHRIDLGGAASDLLPTRGEPPSVHHRPPPDPFSWPSRERPASLQFERALFSDTSSGPDRRGQTADAGTSSTASPRRAANGRFTPDLEEQEETAGQGDSSPGAAESSAAPGAGADSSFSWADPGRDTSSDAGSVEPQVVLSVDQQSHPSHQQK